MTSKSGRKVMKKHALFAIGVGLVFLAYLTVSDSFCRGRGGFGGASRGGGASHGGAYRSGAAVRSPSMSSYSGTRSAASSSRPRSSSHTASRPSTRPSAGNKVAQRPATPTRPPAARPAHPTQGQVSQFLNLPKQPTGGGRTDLAKIGAGVAAGALGAEGAAEAP